MRGDYQINPKIGVNYSKGKMCHPLYVNIKAKPCHSCTTARFCGVRSDLARHE
jgi:hypothetical protein